jgi:hypothetical protein
MRASIRPSMSLALKARDTRSISDLKVKGGGGGGDVGDNKDDDKSAMNIETKLTYPSRPLS